MAAKNLGNGATLTLATTGVTYAITKINLGEWSRGRVNTSTLETEGPMQYIGETLYDHSEIEIEYNWDSEEDLPLALDSTSAWHEMPAAESVTITWPMGTGETTAAKVVGTGFFTSVTFPEFENNTLQAGKAKISWDGETGPKFTAAA